MMNISKREGEVKRKKKWSNSWKMFLEDNTLKKKISQQDAGECTWK